MQLVMGALKFPFSIGPISHDLGCCQMDGFTLFWAHFKYKQIITVMMLSNFLHTNIPFISWTSIITIINQTFGFFYNLYYYANAILIKLHVLYD